MQNISKQKHEHHVIHLSDLESRWNTYNDVASIDVSWEM